MLEKNKCKTMVKFKLLRLSSARLIHPYLKILTVQKVIRQNNFTIIKLKNN